MTFQVVRRFPAGFCRTPERIRRTPERFRRTPERIRRTRDPVRQASNPSRRTGDPSRRAPEPIRCAPERSGRPCDPFRGADEQLRQAPGPLRHLPERLILGCEVDSLGLFIAPRGTVTTCTSLSSQELRAGLPGSGRIGSRGTPNIAGGSSRATPPKSTRSSDTCRCDRVSLVCRIDSSDSSRAG